MLDIKQIKTGDIVKSVNQFSLVQRGEIVEVQYSPTRVVIRPIIADNTIQNVTVYEHGLRLYEPA